MSSFVRFVQRWSARRTLRFGLAGQIGLVVALCASVLLASPAEAASPSAPRELIGRLGSQGEVYLNWTPSASTGGRPITGYNIYRGTSAGGESSTPINSSPVDAIGYVATGHRGLTTYYFVVRAVNADGTSPLSNEVSFTTTILAPSTPTGLTATAGNGQVSLVWDVPFDDGGAAISNYAVYSGDALDPSRTRYDCRFATPATPACVVTGLTNGTRYTFVVTAQNLFGGGAISGTSDPAYATPGLPGTPTGLRAAAGRDQVSLTWTAPAPNGNPVPTGYNIYRSTTAGDEAPTLVNSSPVAGTSSVVTGLTGLTTYYFEVRAVNPFGVSPPSNEVSATTPAGAPGPPTGLTPAPAGVNRVALTWTAPASNGGSPVTGYNVYRGTTARGQSATPVNTSPVAGTSYVATGLTDGTGYYFVVRAITSNGTSVPSNEVSATSAPATVPSAPGGLAASAGNGQVAVSFAAPASDGGAAITSYTVTAVDATIPANGGQTATGSGSPLTVTGLTNGDTYTFTVVATNAVGSSPPSGAVSAQPFAFGNLGPPTGLKAVAGDGQVSLSWTAPGADGGAPIWNYVVYNGNFALTPGVTQWDCHFATPTSTACVVTGLTNGTSYDFFVVSHNTAGAFSSFNTGVSAVPGTPGAPTIGTATAGEGQAVVTFTAPASSGVTAITGYTVTATDVTNPANGGQTASGSASPITVTGLTNGHSYTFTVRARNGVGASPPSAPTTAVTPLTSPSAPVIGTATGGNGQAVVTFTAPASNGGAAITGYTVTVTDVTNPANGGQTPSGAGSPITVTGLTNGHSYTFTVVANNAVGSSPSSASSTAVTPATVPGAPTIGTATVAGGGQAVVTFTAPPTNGGAAITGYTVTVTDVTDPANGGQTASGSGSPITVTGLTNGHSYTFTVVAKNTAGSGAPSAATNAVTMPNVPGAPTIGTATAGNGQAVVTFTAPPTNGGAAITGYTVTAHNSSIFGGQIASGSSSPITVTGLTNGFSYTFTVVAKNTSGSGAPSAPTNEVVLLTAPGAPTIGTATAGNGQAVVTFTPGRVQHGGGDHGLHGHRARPDQPVRQRSDRVGHGEPDHRHRPDQRSQLLLHRRGQQHRRGQRPVGLHRGGPSRRPRRTVDRDGHGRQRPGGGHLRSPGLRRRRSDHELYGHGARLDQPGERRPDRLGCIEPDHGHRSDKRS